MSNQTALTQEQRALAEQYYRLACKEAHSFHRRTGVPLDDCLAESLYHLCRTARWFDPARGKPFAPIAAKIIRRSLSQWAQRWQRSGFCFTDLETYAFSYQVDADALCLRADPPQPEGDHDIGELREVLAKLRSRVDAISWAVLWRHYALGEPFKDIGRKLGVSGSSVQQRCSNAMEKLRRSLVLKEVANVL